MSQATLQLGQRLEDFHQQVELLYVAEGTQRSEVTKASLERSCD